MTSKFTIAARTIFVLFLTLVLHVLAIRLKLYWSLSWFDVILHLLGGMAIGLIFLMFLSRFPLVARKHHWVSLFLVASIVGLGWEVFEYATNLTFAREGYWFDTIQDMIADYVGAFAAFALFRPTSFQTSKSQEFSDLINKSDEYDRNA